MFRASHTHTHSPPTNPPTYTHIHLPHLHPHNVPARQPRCTSPCHTAGLASCCPKQPRSRLSAQPSLGSSYPDCFSAGKKFCTGQRERRATHRAMPNGDGTRTIMPAQRSHALRVSPPPPEAASPRVTTAASTGRTRATPALRGGGRGGGRRRGWGRPRRCRPSPGRPLARTRRGAPRRSAPPAATPPRPGSVLAPCWAAAFEHPLKFLNN